ncbi:unnamed protein product [Dracunculus medinensis]|uniref:FHA domain-containing protein n=1 Tax=Dracunculus medinensis TaxID=318479 RepID=A0A3P7PIK2_DRAME|nr:unnamed protein product [Dracunculus medinensis]
MGYKGNNSGYDAIYSFKSVGDIINIGRDKRFCQICFGANAEGVSRIHMRMQFKKIGRQYLLFQRILLVPICIDLCQCTLIKCLYESNDLPWNTVAFHSIIPFQSVILSTESKAAVKSMKHVMVGCKYLKTIFQHFS